MVEIDNEEKLIDSYPFLQYLKEDKSRYPHAKDMGYIDPDDLFLIGDSGGFLLNINIDDRFVDTHLFTEMADFFRANNGVYTYYKPGSIPYERLRKREEYRRKHGYTAKCRLVNGVKVDCHITGSMYNYLNYTVINMLNLNTINSSTSVNTAEKSNDFPRFIDAQFYTFACMKFAEDNGFNLLIDKTRRGGFSYIMAADTANCINLEPHKACIHVAFNSGYLTSNKGLTDFTISNLNFYENKTPFVRGILSSKAEDFKLGYKLPSGLIPPGSWDSAIYSVSAHRNANCAIGKDATKVKVEEVSTMDNFEEFMVVTEPAMRTGAYVTGTLYAWGTATQGNMQPFEFAFFNPMAQRFLHFENVWDRDSRGEICGYFKPYAWGLEGQIGDRYAMDKDGNSDLEMGLRIAIKERIAKKNASDSFKDYVNYLGQYALFPAESFSSTSENIFSSEELIMWQDQLMTNSTYRDIASDGMLFEDKKDNKVIFKSNARIKAEGGKFNVDYFDYIENVPIRASDHHHGCIRIWFNPLKSKVVKNGQVIEEVPKGLYTMSYDPVGINKDNKDITLKHSHNSIKVWMNPAPINNFMPALVAVYYGRPDRLEQADRIFYLLAKYYNCIGTAGVETNRGETVNNFTKWKATKYLAKGLDTIWNKSGVPNEKDSYGIVIADGNVKLQGLRLLQEMLYSVVGKDTSGNDIYFFHRIYDLPTILELIKWNDKGNFDRVSEMIVKAIDWHKTDIESLKELEHKKKIKNKNVKKDILSREWY